MKIENKLLKSDERVVLELRSLYEKYGYAQYKMSKFEEYDLYVRNKDFLVSDNIITFTDTNGKLMALKPDVTLSIIKSSKDCTGYAQKVYYNENVYRVSKSTESFKEIMQVGLECIGDIDNYCIYEVLNLAAESLGIISDSFVLDISHMGIIYDMIKELELPSDAEKEILKAMGEKNAHQIISVCRECSADEAKAQKIAELATVYGSVEATMDKIKQIAGEKSSEAVRQLEEIATVLSGSGLGDKIHIDFSVVNDMSYYNGIVFKGFVEGIPEGILSGGQYDKLMKKMNRKAHAIGFAVYPDFLERLADDTKEYDVDTVILYDDASDLKTLADAVNMMRASGQSVMAQREVPSKLKYKQLLKMNGKGVEMLENNA